MKRRSNRVRRCRPLLGTYVEISLWEVDDHLVGETMNLAFEAMHTVQKLMSLHDAKSELFRINQWACIKPVRVSSSTWEVLERGLELSQQSQGAFDFTVGRQILDWGYAGAMSKIKPQKKWLSGGWNQIRLMSDHHVYFEQPLILDLGGIAKGYAVDCGVRALQQAGVSSGLINAGGDLRIFGTRLETVHLRDPQYSQSFSHSLELRNMALASSSPDFSRRRIGRKDVSHLVQPFDGSPILDLMSVSVQAKECWLADALTKVVFVLKDQADSILQDYGAKAWLIQSK